MLTREDLNRLCKSININTEKFTTKLEYVEEINKHYKIEIIKESTKYNFYLASREYLKILKDEVLEAKLKTHDKKMYKKNKETKITYYQNNKSRLDNYRNEYNHKKLKEKILENH